MAGLTTPQRNCLLAVYRAHPAVYEVRGAAMLARRLADAGLVVQLARTRTTRRFRLTAAGLFRAEKLADRRDADHGHAAIASALVQAAPIANEPVAARPRGMPEQWPFPASAHDWSRF